MKRYFPILILCLSATFAFGCDKQSPAPETTGPAPATEPATAPSTTGHEHAHDHAMHETLPAAEPAGGSLHQLDIKLEDQLGATLGWKDFAGAPLLVAIIYTSCTTACPMIVAEIKKIREEGGESTRVLLVSMDAEKDDRAALAAMHERHQLDDNWSVARTSEDSLRELAAALGVRYRKLPDGSFNHSQVITLLDGGGVNVARTEGLGPQRADVVKALQGLGN